MSRRGGRKRVAATVLLLGLAVGGCGVTTQEDPRPIDRKDVPFGLLEESASTTGSTSTTSVPRRETS